VQATALERPATVSFAIGGQRVDARVLEWTPQQVTIQPLVERRLWAHAMTPGAVIEVGWPTGTGGWTSGTSRVVRWITAYVLRLEPPWSLADRQRRHNPRVPCSWPVQVVSFWPSPSAIEGRSLDVSESGMAVQVRGAFEAGSRVALSISTMSTIPVTVVAQVMGYQSGDGILRACFVYVPPEDARWWARLMDLLTRHVAS
jgi:hypothetical protein